MKQLSAQEAYEILKSNPEAVYLDVRSVPEFEQGHPDQAINIPILDLVPGRGMAPNPDFAAVVEANISKETQLVIGCKTGGRSARACEILQGMGYSNVSNVRSGFLGALDPFGRIVEPGWSALNLPVCSSCRDEARYATLSSRAKK